MGNKQGASNVDPDLKQGFDINKFLGTWYEIGYNSSKLASCNTTMELSKNTITSEIDIKNYCLDKSGKYVLVNDGIITTELSPKLLIKFKRSNTSVQFWVYKTDYKTYAIALNPSGYYWILSREPTMSFCLYMDLFDSVKIKLPSDRIKDARVSLNSLKYCSVDESRKAEEKERNAGYLPSTQQSLPPSMPRRDPGRPPQNYNFGRN